MAIDTNIDAGTQTLVIRVSGRFDFGVHQDFRKATELATQEIKTIVVDMANTDYVDSSALGMLLVLRDKVGDNKSAVLIKSAKPDVRKILEIANFDKLFTLS
ncbi:MAG: STAS domain-containing protein [Methylococcales bacterium]|nr:STAS domain-containing protein [Methylococcales bacterium]